MYRVISCGNGIRHINQAELKNLWKFTNITEVHYRMKYKTGINVNIEEFRCEKKCSHGGMYFATEHQLGKLIKSENGIPYVHLRKVGLTRDSLVADEGDKYKTNVFELGPAIKISEWIETHLEMAIKFASETPEWFSYFDQEGLVKAMEVDGMLIKFVPNEKRTLRVCLAAVRQNGLSLAYLTDEQRTPQICWDAVKNDEWAALYLKDGQSLMELVK